MSIHFVVVVVSVFVFNNRGSNCQTFTIRRFPGQKSNIRDSFDIAPLTLLSQAPCAIYSAVNVRNKPQRCVCPSNKQTFGLFNNRWQCYDNSVIRSSQGCNAKMYDWEMQYYSPVVFIIKSVQQNQYFQSDRNVARWRWPDDCRLNALQTQYRACNGTWLPQVNAGSKFSIKATNSQDYELQVQQLGKDFSGRLIKVGIQCDVPTSGGFTAVDDCLMIKVAGTTTCRVTATPSSRVPTTSAPVTTSTTIPLLPSSPPVNATKNITSVGEPGGDSAQTARDGSAGAIVGAVFAVLIVLVGAIVTVLVLKRKGKLGPRKADHVGEQLTENPSYGAIVNLQFSGDNACAEKGADPQSPLYAVIGKKECKRQQTEIKDGCDKPSIGEGDAVSGTEYPDYARVKKVQTPPQCSQSDTYDYACTEGPIGRTKVPTGHLGHCPLHTSKTNVSRTFSSDSNNYETLEMAKDNARCELSRHANNKEEDNNSIYDVPEMPIVDELERQPGDGVGGGGATSQPRKDNDGYEVPKACSMVDKRRALFELKMSEARNEKGGGPLPSIETRTATNDEDYYSVLECETPEKEHVYQPLRDSCDIYEALQTIGTLGPSSPQRPLSLEHEFDETPI